MKKIKYEAKDPSLEIEDIPIKILKSESHFLVRLHQGKPALAGSLIPLKINKMMKQKDI